MGKFDPISEEISVNFPGNLQPNWPENGAKTTKNLSVFFVGDQVNMTFLSGLYQTVYKHILQVPGSCFDLSLTKSDLSNLQKIKNKTPKQLPKLSTNFLTEPQNEFHLGILITSY